MERKVARYQKYVRKISQLYARGYEFLDGATLEGHCVYWERRLFHNYNDPYARCYHLLVRAARGLEVKLSKEVK